MCHAGIEPLPEYAGSASRNLTPFEIAGQARRLQPERKLDSQRIVRTSRGRLRTRTARYGAKSGAQTRCRRRHRIAISVRRPHGRLRPHFAQHLQLARPEKVLAPGVAPDAHQLLAWGWVYSCSTPMAHPPVSQDRPAIPGWQLRHSAPWERSAGAGCLMSHATPVR